jgi:hypothetical protein
MPKSCCTVGGRGERIDLSCDSDCDNLYRFVLQAAASSNSATHMMDGLVCVHCHKFQTKNLTPACNKSVARMPQQGSHSMVSDAFLHLVHIEGGITGGNAQLVCPTTTWSIRTWDDDKGWGGLTGLELVGNRR